MIKKIFFPLFVIFILAITGYSQTRVKYNGIASKGGKLVKVSSSSSYILLETYPQCVVTVYNTGTLTLSTIYSDEAGTPKSNPFTSNTDASYSFYANSGRYDVKFSGTGITSPFTISDIFMESGGGGAGGVETFNGRAGIVLPLANDYTWAQINKTTSSLADITVKSAGDLTSGTLPDARFPTIFPVVNGSLLTNLNGSNITSGIIAGGFLDPDVAMESEPNTFTNQNFFTAGVAINTFTPTRRLEVLDASNAQFRLTSVANSIYTDFYVDSGGTLNILPTGNIVFDAVGNQVNPLNNYDQNLGQINKKYLSLWAAELNVETLVAQNTIATIGGRILVAPTNTLIADLAAGVTTINVKYNNFNNGDRVYMESGGSVEFFAITSGASAIPGGFSYAVTRNLDGTGSNQWYAGDAMLDTGVSGNGFIDIYSVRGVKSSAQLGPTIVGNVRNSLTYNDWTENWAIGNLNGLYGYGSDIYGAAFGKYSASTAHVTIDSVAGANGGYRIFNGLSTIVGQWANDGSITIGQVAPNTGNVRISAGSLVIRNNTTNRIALNPDGSGFLANNLIAWDTSGNLTITGNAVIGGVTIGNGKMFIGTGTFNNTNTAFYVDSLGQFSLKDKLSWNGTTLNVSGGIVAESLSGALTGTLTLGGTVSALTIGNPPPTSASNGTGVWIDRTGFYGLATNVVQTKIDAATGKITAGAGIVYLDANGLSLADGVAGANTIKWTDGVGGATAAGIYADASSGTTQAHFNAFNQASTDQVQISLRTIGQTQSGELLLQTNSNTSVSWATFSGGGTGTGFRGLAISPNNAATPTALLDIVGDTIRIETPKTPASASATCNQGDIVWDTGFIYVCTATNTWKRAAIATW